MFPIQISNMSDRSLLTEAMTVFSTKGCYKSELGRVQHLLAKLHRIEGKIPEANEAEAKALQLYQQVFAARGAAAPRKEPTDEDYNNLVVFWSR